jgi:hypothetical protein
MSISDVGDSGTGSEKTDQDQQLDLKVRMWRNRLLGLWAARRLGLDGVDSQLYAKRLATDDYNKSNQLGTLERIAKDLAEKGINISTEELVQELERVTIEAKRLYKG